MFHTLIYFNREKVITYKSLIEGKKAIDFKDATLVKDKGGKAIFPIMSGEMGTTSELKGEVLANYLLDCKEFEDILFGRDDYFDLLNDDVDGTTIPKSSIIRFSGTINIPEEFHMLELINKFKPLIVNSVQVNSTEEREVLGAFLGKDSTRVPLFIEPQDFFDEKLCFAKVNSNNFCYDFENLDDFENEEVTILAKIISRKTVNGNPIVVYDVLKDLFSMNRTLRRKLDILSSDPEIKNITLDENYIQLEVLAIYQ